VTLRPTCFALAVLAAAQAGRAADEDAVLCPAALVELKRQATARGTPDETTKTNLKFDCLRQSGPVSLLRLELPFPDAKASFSGSILDPEFGDAKVRIGFRAVTIAARPTTSFVELTFPTADPESQGTGKYQLSVGARIAFALQPGPLAIGAPGQAMSVQLQQVASFAGDPGRKDINQTKFELEWRDTWQGGHYAKATAKPVIDWVGNGQTGAVVELEGGWAVDRHWTLALLIGAPLWGEGVPGTYRSRAEIKVVRRY